MPPSRRLTQAARRQAAAAQQSAPAAAPPAAIQPAGASSTTIECAKCKKSAPVDAVQGCSNVPKLCRACCCEANFDSFQSSCPRHSRKFPRGLMESITAKVTAARAAATLSAATSAANGSQAMADGAPAGSSVPSSSQPLLNLDLAALARLQDEQIMLKARLESLTLHLAKIAPPPANPVAVAIPSPPSAPVAASPAVPAAGLADPSSVPDQGVHPLQANFHSHALGITQAQQQMISGFGTQPVSQPNTSTPIHTAFGLSLKSLLSTEAREQRQRDKQFGMEHSFTSGDELIRGVREAANLISQLPEVTKQQSRAIFACIESVQSALDNKGLAFANTYFKLLQQSLINDGIPAAWFLGPEAPKEVATIWKLAEIASSSQSHTHRLPFSHSTTKTNDRHTTKHKSKVTKSCSNHPRATNHSTAECRGSGTAAAAPRQA